MAHCFRSRLALWSCGLLCLFSGSSQLRADDSALVQQLRLLQEQNEALRAQLQKQQDAIDALTRQVSVIQQSDAQRKQEIADLKTESAPPASTLEHPEAFALGKIKISGEGGVAFFNSGAEGMYPNADFTVDEARLFLDAPIWDNVYTHAEVDFATRENQDYEGHLGEFYVDFEDVSQLWGRDRLLNVRAGRFYTPFGEEYQHRFAIDNPLISHSLSDLWGLDEGIALYGSAGKFCYVVAVQNGGMPDSGNLNADKAVMGRIGYDPANWLHLSVSGMRTGNLNAQDHQLSEMWFGNGFFRSIGGTNTTDFGTELVEGDVMANWRGGHVDAFGGYIHYGDNDPGINHQRDVYYYSVEGEQVVVGKLYAAARFSQILAHNGFPIVGNGMFGEYLFGPLTDDLWRLSAGVGYRWSQHLVLKGEYTFERGQQVNGVQRDHEDLFAAELAFSF